MKNYKCDQMESPLILPEALGTIGPSCEVWSLFSGAMGLDLGLEQVGLPATLVNEIEPKYCDTIRANRPNITIIEGSATDLTGAKMRERRNGFKGDVFLIAGGPPCQSYSSGGKRAAMSDPRGTLVNDFFRIVSEVQPRYFIMENVANLATAALKHRPISQRPGKHWSLKKYDSLKGQLSLSLDDEAPPLEEEELAGSALRALLSDVVQPLGYQINFGVLDAADYGAPQHRLRFIMLGSRHGPTPALPKPTHGLSEGLLPFETVRDAIWHLQDNPGEHSIYTPEFERLFSLVPEGGNWRDLPSELHREALGGAYESGGGKTGFFRRLAWDRPAPTMTGKANRKASALCHPVATRPISARECAALQGFPPEWKFLGAPGQQFMQAGNAVPVALGRAVGRSIIEHMSLTAEAKTGAIETAPISSMMDAAMRRLRSAGANNKSRRKTA